MFTGGIYTIVVSDEIMVGGELNLPLGSKYHNRNNITTSPVMVSAVILLCFKLPFLLLLN